MNVDPNKILKCINQQIYLKDLDGRYQWVNEHFAKVAGMTPDELIGKSDYDLIWREQADYFNEDDKAVIAGTPLVNVERLQSRLNGMTKIILNLTPYKSSGGDIVGVLGNFFDCTEHLVIQTKGTYQNNKFYLEFVNEWLSGSELRVLFWLLSGFPPEKISEKTKTTVSTVRYHLENIKNKMGCAHKNEIQKVAIEHGIFWKIFTLQHQIDDSLQNESIE